MKQILGSPRVRLALEIGLILLVLVLVLAPEASQTVEAADPSAITVYWYQCNAPNHIATFTDRVHIYCGSTTPVLAAPALSSSIHYFAVPTYPDSAGASRFMSLLQTSVITSRVIWVQAAPTDTSGVSFGCSSVDCRRMYGTEMR